MHTLAHLLYYVGKGIILQQRTSTDDFFARGNKIKRKSTDRPFIYVSEIQKCGYGFYTKGYYYKPDFFNGIDVRCEYRIHQNTVINPISRENKIGDRDKKILDTRYYNRKIKQSLIC